MKIFKFGGASIKNADAINHVMHILQQFSDEPLFLVVSAIDKTTNALELVVQQFLSGNRNIQSILQPISTFHQQIADQLSISFQPVQSILDDLATQLENTSSTIGYDEFYDQIVSYGECLSLEIIDQCLQANHFDSTKIDAKKWVKTDNYFRFAGVDLATSEFQLRQIVSQHPTTQIFVTQGFIGSTIDHRTTTLGREGSDYTAALAGSFLQAHSVTVWKDVPGILNADPKFFSDAVKMPQLSYNEAIELAYYGAKVIHPKTIKPLENANIPLYVRSFVNATEEGTIIDNNKKYPKTPSLIIHDHQLLITISVKDMSFITEELMHHIFGVLAQCRVKVNMMQNSALSLSLCVDADPTRTNRLIEQLSEYYFVRFNADLQLITIRHYTTQTINKLLKNKEILLEQRNRIMAQFVTR